MKCQSGGNTAYFQKILADRNRPKFKLPLNKLCHTKAFKAKGEKSTIGRKLKDIYSFQFMVNRGAEFASNQLLSLLFNNKVSDL